MLTNDQMKPNRFYNLWAKKYPARYMAQWNDQAGTWRMLSMAEIDATICKPKYFFYLDSVSALNGDGEPICTVKYDPNYVPPKRKRKPSITHCPHCGKNLKAPVEKHPAAEVRPFAPKTEEVKFVEVNGKFISYRVPA